MSDQQIATTGASVPALHLNLDLAGAKSDAAIAPAGDPALDKRADEFVQRLLELGGAAIRVAMTRPRRSRPWDEGCSARPRSAARC